MQQKSRVKTCFRIFYIGETAKKRIFLLGKAGKGTGDVWRMTCKTRIKQRMKIVHGRLRLPYITNENKLKLLSARITNHKSPATRHS